MAPVENHPVLTRRIEANGLSFVIDECGEGPDVALFLHGFPEARQAWRAQLSVLARLGWRAIAPDLRGYGESSRPKGRSAYSLDHLTADVAAMFDTLGARRRLLIGHDWGGLIAWTTAARHMASLDGVAVLNAPHPAVYRAVAKRSLKQIGKSWYAAFFQLPGLPEYAMTTRKADAVAKAFKNHAKPSAFDLDIIEIFRSNILQPGAATAMINYYRANGKTMWLERFERPIACPSLLIWGEEDFALDIALTEGYAPYASDFSLVRLPGVSHWVQYEAPDEVNAALESWMRTKGLVLEPLLQRA